MEFDQIATTVRGLRNMTPEQGRRIYDHVRGTQPREILELGTSYGVSAAYMAAALDANGRSRRASARRAATEAPAERRRAASREPV
jgi:predicted O-methyltransferase YrrM